MFQPASIMLITKCQGIYSMVFGVFELIMGATLVGFSWLLERHEHISALPTAYWAGMTYLVPGGLGIIGGATRKKSYIFAAMVVNTVLAVSSMIVSILMTTEWVSWHATSARCVFNVDGSCRCSSSGGRIFSVPDCSELDNVTAYIAAIAIVCYICAVMSAVHPVVGCTGSRTANCEPVEKAAGVSEEALWVINSDTGAAPPPYHEAVAYFTLEDSSVVMPMHDVNHNHDEPSIVE